MDFLEILPKEIFIEIFDFLSASDLLSISLTCKKFNEIIKSSTKISKKFELQFTSKNVNCDWIRTRKITRAFIDGSVAKHFLYIFANIGNEFEEVIIDCYEIDVLILKQILLMFGKLKKLWVYNVIENSEDPRDFKGQLPELDLEFLYFQGEIGVFRILKNCKSISLDVRRDYDDENRNVDGLKQFLKSQNSLENLSLENFDRNSSIFNENLELKFKIKKLKLKYFDDFNTFFFKEFIESQKETLTHLEVSQVHHDLLALFKKFKHLKNLKIRNVCSNFDPMPSIETLEIKEVDGKWSEKFPKVQNLTIVGGNEDVQQIENLKNLKVLKIKNCEIPELKIPTVKSLTLTRVSIYDDVRPFDFENEIEELKIDKCTNLQWLFEFLISKNFNLKSLILRKSKLIDEDWKFIEEFKTGRIKHFQIINCHGITDEDIENDMSDYSDEDEDENEEEGAEENEDIADGEVQNEEENQRNEN
ncbi:hypothetical protein PVAND_015196 [Polypedilum vanderplanki]|uniref:F-box domain-containing protein n=1 Tax=Polypedilum vanderplanki TaxID=319348 RepID=A0A9J6BBX6_POLVA|nr:hypothetical protein PVAND_015196 [Polypedilum vanderplanki]